MPIEAGDSAKKQRQTKEKWLFYFDLSIILPWKSRKFDCCCSHFQEPYGMIDYCYGLEQGKPAMLSLYQKNQLQHHPPLERSLYSLLALTEKPPMMDCILPNPVSIETVSSMNATMCSFLQPRTTMGTTGTTTTRRRFIRASRKPPRAPLLYRANCVPLEFLMMLQRHRVLKRRVRDEEEEEDDPTQTEEGSSGPSSSVPTKMCPPQLLATVTNVGCEKSSSNTAESSSGVVTSSVIDDEPVVGEGRSVFDEPPWKPLNDLELVPVEEQVWLPGPPGMMNEELHGRIKHWKQFKAVVNVDIRLAANPMDEFDENEFTTILDRKKVSRRQKKLASKIATELFAEKPKKKLD